MVENHPEWFDREQLDSVRKICKTAQQSSDQLQVLRTGLPPTLGSSHKDWIESSMRQVQTAVRRMRRSAKL
jgi:hypothetical protein